MSSPPPAERAGPDRCTGSRGDRRAHKINRLVHYVCPETCKQYRPINTKHISAYLSSWERHSFSPLPKWWASSLGCFLVKRWIYSPLPLPEHLHVSNLADLRGAIKKVHLGCAVWCPYLHSDIRCKTLTGPRTPPQALPTWKQSQRLLQFKLVDTFLGLNVSFRRRNGSQSARQQLRETLLLDGDAWCLSEIQENNTFPSCRGNLEKKRRGCMILVILSL